MSELLVVGNVFAVMLCYRPIQRLSDDRSINLNLSDHVLFLRESMKLAISKIGRIEHVLFVITLNTNYRDTWHDTWSSSVLAKIFIIDEVAVGFTPNVSLTLFLDK